MKQFIFFVLAAFSLTAAIMVPFAGSIPALPSWISSADPLLVVSLWAAGFALCSFLSGMFTGDYSWVDRLWSTLPALFVWFYTWRGGFAIQGIFASILVSIWAIRLTANFAIKGGYSGSEDYRWSILRERIRHPVLWQLFNLLFISAFQVSLFVLFTLPVRAMALGSQTASISVPWALCAVLAGLFILIEGLADRQQWLFQEAKRRHREGHRVEGPLAGDIERGFLSHGLFAHSRHPNYFGELGFWWALWLMAFATGAPLLPGTGTPSSGILGALLLSILFVGSTIFTESITASKYAAYREYQKRVSAIIPWFVRRNP